VFIISLAFTVCAAAVLSVGINFWSNAQTLELVNPETNKFKKLSNGKEHNNVWIMSMLGALSVTLMLYYCYMRHILNTYFSNSLQAEKRKINILFATFLIAYTLRTLTSLFQPYYSDAVC